MRALFDGCKEDQKVMRSIVEEIAPSYPRRVSFLPPRPQENVSPRAHGSGTFAREGYRSQRTWPQNTTEVVHVSARGSLPTVLESVTGFLKVGGRLGTTRAQNNYRLAQFCLDHFASLSASVNMIVPH